MDYNTAIELAEIEAEYAANWFAYDEFGSSELKIARGIRRVVYLVTIESAHIDYAIEAYLNRINKIKRDQGIK